MLSRVMSDSWLGWFFCNLKKFGHQKSSFLFLNIFLMLGISNTISAKILIFTYACNQPGFIPIQDKTLKKFLKDEYEFIVFNDARYSDMQNSIERTCKKYGIRCIPIPQEIHSQPYLERLPREGYHNPSVRNCNVVQYSLNEVGFKHDDIVVLLDSDLFLVRDFSIRDYLKGHDIAGVYQVRGEVINYLWIGLAFLNMATMPNKKTINFNCGRINDVGADAGGYTHYYLKDNPQARVKYFDGQTFENIQKYKDMSPQVKSILKGLTTSDFFFVDNKLTFLHYRAGSNWDRKSRVFHDDKVKKFNTYFDLLLDKSWFQKLFRKDHLKLG